MTLNLDKSAWETVKFGDVARNVNETVRDAATAGIERVIGLEHLNGGELEIVRWGDDPTATTFTKRVKPGQTLFGKRRAYQRKAAYAEFDAITSGDILVFEANPARLDPELLPFLVQSERFFDHALGTSAGSLSPRTNWGDLAKFEFALPPLAEQRRLAELLWSAEHHRRASREAAAAAATVLVQLRDRHFGQAPSTVRADQVFEITMGRQRSPVHASGAHLVPYMRSANVTSDGIAVGDTLEMNFTPVEQEKFALRPGDVLVSEGSASAIAVGMPAVWNGELDGVVCFQNTLLRYRPRDGRSTSTWVDQYCRWAFESGEFFKVSSGTNIHHIGSGGASAMKVRDADLAEQVEFLGPVLEAESVHDAVRRELDTTTALQRSILQEVFG